jgi:hypothetical protein
MVLEEPKNFYVD